jgi:hypothetical protein
MIRVVRSQMEGLRMILDAQSFNVGLPNP